MTLALAGDTADALHLAGDLRNRFPQDTIGQFLPLPHIRAEAALRNSDFKAALDTLAAAAPYELRDAAAARMGLRGNVYLAAHRDREAVVEFQKILDHPGLVGNTIFGPPAHLGLGRA